MKPVPAPSSPPFPWRVASVPAGHPYVQALRAPGDTRVDLRPDPPPLVADPLPGQWWPPRWLDPEFVDAHAHEVDLVHLHFGFDSFPPEHLRAWTAALRRHGLPLVLTVHDLINPHVADPDAHLAQLDVLVPAAAAVATLTPGAAAFLDTRWGRTATVIPHPHLVPLDRPLRRAAPGGPFVIGVHAKELRANIDPVPVVDALLRVVRDRPGVILRVDAHPGTVDPASPDPRRVELRRWIDAHRTDPGVRVHVHPRFSDDELWTYLAGLDLCVLPYRFGTHSGWLEACVDLGVPVLVPEVGFLAEQHGHPSFPHPRDADPQPLVEAVGYALDHPRWALRSAPDRLRQRTLIGDAHIRLYSGALLRQRSVSADRPTG